MKIKNNSSQKPYSIAGYLIPQNSERDIPDEYYDDIQGIEDLQLVGSAPAVIIPETTRTINAVVNANNELIAFADTNGNRYPRGGSTAAVQQYKPPISQYDRALIFPHMRQTNAVKGLSRNINDVQYVGAITDAEVYGTEAGAISVGQDTTKALAFHWEKMLWDLAAGESLLVQCRFKTVGATTGARIIFGNSNGAAAEGWNIQLYGPTDSGQAGRLILNYKTSTNASNRQLQPATVGGGSVGSVVLPTDAYQNLTMVIEGGTRRMDSWVNCQQSLQAASILQPGSWIPAVKRNFGFGHAPTDDSFTVGTTTAQPVRIQAFRMAVLPAGLQFANPGWLDLQFNINPFVIFNDTDYLGAM